MRRLERNDGGGGRGNGNVGTGPFRILESGSGGTTGRFLENLTPPPPPRAPEPYKVGPPSSSLGRAHRRSSFVIIAETRPATPRSTSPSPSHFATGRVSPFRGRGFKGPLPHAQSRSQSPENRLFATGRRNARLDRRASVSQQNSPKRSLIPQPTKRRSVSLPKTAEGKSSPKFGRRATMNSRKNSREIGKMLNVPGNISRRQSLKPPDLSPIQGTPTKPMEGTTKTKPIISQFPKNSPIKSRNSSLLTIPKNGIGNPSGKCSQEKSPRKFGTPKTKRFIEEKKNAEESCPTKIAMRRGSIIKKNVLISSSNGTKGGKPGEKSTRDKENVGKKESEAEGLGKRILGRSGSRELESNNAETMEETKGSRFIEIDSPPERKKRQDDLGLIDLLKQSSGATGTSSVVNTTTTTAVQPLQIEAAAVLLENDRTNKFEVPSKKNKSISTSPATNDVSQIPGVPSNLSNDGVPSKKRLKSCNGTQEKLAAEKMLENRDNDNADSKSGSSTVPGLIPSQKNSTNNDLATVTTVGHTLKKDLVVNGQNIKEKTTKDPNFGGNDSSKKNVPARNGQRERSRGEIKVPSTNSVPSRLNNPNNNDTNGTKPESNGNGKIESVETTENTEKIENSGKILVAKTSEAVGTILSSDDKKSESRTSAKSIKESFNYDETLDSVDSKKLNNREETRFVATVSPGKMEKNDGNSVRGSGKNENNLLRTSMTTTTIINQGNDSSFESSNGLSAGSVDSIRSTDTGVSVNTVRGVSSAREKKGMHMMKKSEEIETLSGNLMHLERNGEPDVLEIAEDPEENSEQENTRFVRFKKSISRFRHRFPKMRCLGCRREKKGHPWPGEDRNQSQESQREVANVCDANANAGASRIRRFCTNFQKICRCTRLCNCKCCGSAARVAPVESSTTCCPPERKCGAICRRLFSRCKCSGNKSEAQRTRSIRAKHSLTSVAPPPLSEEQRSKIPEVLVEHNSVMRGAIPCLPVPLAWFCLVWNVLLPGTGTVWSGLFNLCVGQPRFSISASPRARFGALIVNLIVGVGQLFTVLFCLVGWGWSIWWGVTMVRLARKYKRFRASEAANGDIEARGGEPTGLPPGVPSQALRGMERAR